MPGHVGGETARAQPLLRGREISLFDGRLAKEGGQRLLLRSACEFAAQERLGAHPVAAGEHRAPIVWIGLCRAPPAAAREREQQRGQQRPARSAGHIA